MFRKLSPVAAALLLLATPVLAQMTAGALEAVPEDAQVVVVMPSVERFGGGVGALIKALGITEMGEFNASTLATESLEVGDGLDLSGTWIAALRTEDSSNPLLIVAVKDAAAWKKAASAEEAAGGLSKAIVHGEDWYVADKPGLMLLCQDQDYLKSAVKSSAKAAESIRKRAGDALDKHSLVFVVDVQGCKDAIQQGMTTFETMIRMGMAMQGGSKAEAGLAFWRWMFEEVRGVMADVDSAVAGVTVGADGVRLGAHCTVRGGSKSADWLKSIKRGDASLLRGLPDEPFGIALACEWEGGQEGSSVSARMLKAMLDATAVEGADVAKAQAALDKSIEMYKLMTGYNAIIVPPGEGGGMLLSGAYFTSKPKEFAKAFEAMMQDTTALAGTFGMGMKFDTAHSSEKIGASDVEVYGFKFDVKDEQTAQMIKMLYSDDSSMLLTPRDRNVSYAVGPTAAARACMKRTLEASDGALDKNKSVADAARAISPKPHGLVLLDLPRAAEWVLRMASATGAPVPPIEFGDKSAPLLAAGMYLDAQPRVELFVPAPALRIVMDAARGAGGGEPR